MTLTVTAVDDGYDEAIWGADNQIFTFRVECPEQDPKYNLDNTTFMGSIDGGSSYTSGRDNFSIVSIDNDTARIISPSTTVPKSQRQRQSVRPTPQPSV